MAGLAAWAGGGAGPADRRWVRRLAWPQEDGKTVWLTQSPAGHRPQEGEAWVERVAANAVLVATPLVRQTAGCKDVPGRVVPGVGGRLRGGRLLAAVVFMLRAELGAAVCGDEKQDPPGGCVTDALGWWAGRCGGPSCGVVRLPKEALAK